MCMQSMSQLGASLTNYSSQNIKADKRRHEPSSSSQLIWSYWCATYLDKTRTLSGNICPQCEANNNSELTSFPIVSNELFTFDHNDKREVEHMAVIPDFVSSIH
jgi:hypothetical protein